jgi:hypothetical protein
VEDSVKDDILPKLLRQFEDAADSTVTYRADAERWRDYYDGKQYTSAEIATLKKRGQPIIVDNRLADKVQYLLGMERRARTDPKAYPRTPNDEGAAEAATDGIRYVFDCNDFHQRRSDVFEMMCVEGMGAVEVVRDGNKDKIRRIRWDRFYVDPHSMELDYSDALYMGVIAWFDASRLKQKYPNAQEAIEGSITDAQRTYTETFDDKPQHRWIDVKRRRIQVFEHYFWDGEWKRAVFFKGGFLEPPATSAYLDEDKVPECPIIAQAAFRDRDGNPYGVVRRYKDLQDEINKRRSKALHMLSTRRVVAEKGAVDDVQKARQEVQKPDGYVETTPGMKFEVGENTELGQGQFNLLVDAINALSSTGPNAALQGTSGQISGRAKELDQEGGAIQIGPLFDQIRHFQKRVARATWNRIKQFWTEETWVRVTDDEQKPRYVGFNTPVTAGEMQMEQLKGLPPEQVQAAAQQIAMDPMSQVPVGKKNDPATMHVDIIIEESPDTVTVQQEQFEQLVQLATAKAVVFPPEVYVEASGLRNKQRMLEKLKGMGESPEQQQAMQEQQAAQRAMVEAELRQKQASATKTEAEAVKVMSEVENNALTTQVNAEKAGAEIARTHADIRRSQVDSAVSVHNATQPKEPAASKG